MNYEIKEVIPEPIPEKTVHLTLTTAELGLIVWAMKTRYDKYSTDPEATRLRDDLAHIEGVLRGY